MSVFAQNIMADMELSRNSFFRQEWLAANTQLERVLALDPHHQEAHFFHAFTRLMEPIENNETGSDPTTFTDSFREILDQFGAMPSSSVSYRKLPGILPTDSPSSGDIQTFIEKVLIPEITQAIQEDLSLISTDFSTIVTSEEWVAIQGIYADATEIDYADIKLVELALRLLKMHLFIILAYDIDVDIDNLEKQQGIFSLQSYLYPLYPELMTLRPGKETFLAQAKVEFIAAIDAYHIASDFIRNETDYQYDDLVMIESTDVSREEILRNQLMDMRVSLTTVDNKPVSIEIQGKNLVLNLNKLFDASLNLRTLSPDRAYDTETGQTIFLADTPDPTYSGLLPSAYFDSKTEILHIPSAWITNGVPGSMTFMALGSMTLQRVSINPVRFSLIELSIVNNFDNPTVYFDGQTGILSMPAFDVYEAGMSRRHSTQLVSEPNGKFFGLVSAEDRNIFATSALTISPPSATLSPGGQIKLTANGAQIRLTSNGTVAPLNWTANYGELTEQRRQYATMPQGTIEPLQADQVLYTAAHEPGIYTIAVSDGAQLGTALITVKDMQDAVVRLSIPGGDSVLPPDENILLSVDAWLADKSRRDYRAKVNWESSNPGVATINGGSLQTLAEGETQITATYAGKSTHIQLTVQAQYAGLKAEPSPLRLSSGARQTLTLTRLHGNGSSKSIAADNCLFASLNNSIARVDNGLIEATGAGHTRIQVDCENQQIMVPVFVGNPLSLQVDPKNLDLGTREKASIRISGGMPPYTAQAMRGRLKGAGAKRRYIAPRNSGMDSISITDNEGTQVSIAVNISGGLALTPLAASLALAEQQTLEVSGGHPPYVWLTTAGNLDNLSADSIHFSADIQGVFQVTVSDRRGQTLTSEMNVQAGLLITPRQLVLEPNEEKIFRVTGGTPPYSASTVTGSISQQGHHVFHYSAGEVDGDYTISVRDREGRQGLLEVRVGRSPEATPAELFLQPGETAQVTLSGGYGQYTPVAQRGEVLMNENTLSYTAPQQRGNDLISLTDDKGEVVQVTVQVSASGLYLSPGREYRLPGESVTLQALGGTAPYTWQTTGGDFDRLNGERVQLTVPDSTGQLEVTVTDNTGKQSSGEIIVYQGELQISPQTLVLNRGQNAQLQALFGLPGYTWSSQRGSFQSNTGETVTYTAPEKGYRDLIRLVDATGGVKTLKVNLSGGAIKDVVDLYAGEDRQLDTLEMEQSFEDYFQQQDWLNRKELFLLTETFLQENGFSTR
ncbi:hypothetical protein [Candidatus Venteria ishoeyi]|nr:hypothetical protein [Candidatus Venteria ishoeyi]